ncbi:MAG: serine--tRNA ligase [Saprospiraceae bacterium]|nr:serine--tRNA ligase [Candidatus Opimibacter iunctus]
MLEIQILRDQKARAVAGLKKRGFSEERLLAIDQIVSLDDQRKDLQTQLDVLLNERNTLSEEIGNLFKSGKAQEANQLKVKVQATKDAAEALESKLQETKAALDALLVTLPNIPHTTVPEGKTPEDNKVHKAWEGALPTLPANAIPHWELAEKYNLIDFKLGTFLTGSGFPLYRGKGARLQRALISYFLDQARRAGFEEIQPPLMVNAESAYATGQLPDKEAQMYYVEKDDLYLIPTAEVPVTNMYRGQIVAESDLPIKLTAYTPCFRREAGSYGSDVKGLNRVHQFDKVEIVQFEHPSRSYDTLMEMVSHVSHLMDSLELPYRILHLCGGDMGFTSATTYDFEVWSAAQQKWLEVSSVSNFESFQANRMKMRFRDDKGKMQLVHTLNGSALALARIVAALLENNQTEKGIRLPQVLVPYTGFEWIGEES